MIPRRELLSLGTSLCFATAFTGCISVDYNPDSTGQATSTPTDTPTPTPTDTPTPTPTDTPESKFIRHSTGERFIVGSGEQKVEYIVNNVFADEIIGGSTLNIESDGIFLVIELSITNRGTETFSISSDLFTAAASPEQGGEEARYEVISGSSYIAADDSIEGEPILFEDIQPNIETDGAIAFDVPYGYNTALIIEPAGAFSTAKDHTVNIGTMPTRDET